MPGHADERLQLTRSASEHTALPRSIFGPRSLPMKHGPLDAKLPSLLVVCHPSRTLLHVDARTTSPLFRCQACHTPPRDDSIKAVPESNPFPLPCKSSEVPAASTTVSAPSRPGERSHHAPHSERLPGAAAAGGHRPRPSEALQGLCGLGFSTFIFAA